MGSKNLLSRNYFVKVNFLELLPSCLEKKTASTCKTKHNYVDLMEFCMVIDPTTTGLSVKNSFCVFPLLLLLQGMKVFC